MKNKFGWIIVVAALLAFSNCLIYAPYGDPYSEPEVAYGRTMEISYFYDYLSDYGLWVYWPGYDYVWIPHHVDYGWHPYSNGRWIWTDCGWTWVSYERWGWIPFHYGRWVWARGFGWFWVPDTVWGPAWVSWRYNASWIGWAPLPPHYRYSHRYGLAMDDMDLDDECWLFVSSRHFQADHLDRYALGRERNRELIRTTVFKARISEAGGRPVNDGLDRNEIGRLTKAVVPIYELQNAARPDQSGISSGRVNVFRPDITSNPSAKPRSYLNKEEAERERGLNRTRKNDSPQMNLTSTPGPSANMTSQTAPREEPSRMMVDPRSTVRETRPAPVRATSAPIPAPPANRTYQTVPREETSQPALDPRPVLRETRPASIRRMPEKTDPVETKGLTSDRDRTPRETKAPRTVEKPAVEKKRTAENTSAKPVRGGKG